MALDCASVRPSSNSTAIELEELLGTAFALESIDMNPGIGQRKPVADPLHLQAIARIEIAVDFHPVVFGGTTEQQAASMMSIIQLWQRVGLALNETPGARLPFGSVRTCSRYPDERCSSRFACP